MWKRRPKFGRGFSVKAPIALSAARLFSNKNFSRFFKATEMRKQTGPRITREDLTLEPRARKSAPFDFVLEALAPLSPRTNPMFGCLAIYVGEKIVGVLRDKPTAVADNGFWLATTCEHHESLREEFPNMRSIQVFGTDVSGWQVLPSDTPDFEQAALRACELILARDPRIGKIPKPKKKTVRKARR
jgi:hypothetical protein